MKLDIGETDFRINVSFAAAVTLMLILDSSGLCAASLFCCIMHELCHIVCMVFLGEKPKLIELSFYGIKLERERLCEESVAREAAVYASGPAGNFLLAAIIFILSERFEGLRSVAVISLCIGVFNLIPCKFLDGGNLLLWFLSRRMNREKAEAACNAVSVAVLVPMSVAGIFVMIKSGNFTLIAVAVYLAAAMFFEKK